MFNSAANFDSPFSRTNADTLKEDSLNSAIQNPPYDENEIDAWGMKRYGGYDDAVALRTHHKQYQQDGNIGYDAAAWQLKVITLPSGGRIHVQYEQNTYSVCARSASNGISSDKKVLVEVIASIFSTSMYRQYQARDYNALVKSIADYASGNKLYFKFLMPLHECAPLQSYVDSTGVPDSSAEYITGYVDAVDDTANYSSSTNSVQLKIRSEIPITDYLVDFVRSRKLIIDPCSNRFTSSEAGSLGLLTTKIYDVFKASLEVSSFAETASHSIYTKHSYLRIPCQFKYGAGVRVKRIFLYDKGIENGTASMYGTEYIYESGTGASRTSFGVATNEPGSVREENALSKFLIAREEKSFLDELATGPDLDQFEGPIPFSQLPAPSVGYSRVVMKPIVDNSTAPGFTVAEFYTMKDYPTEINITEIDDMQEFLPPLPLWILSVNKGGLAASQGFAIHHKGMHGKPKSVKKCGGQFTFDEKAWDVVESVEHKYFEPGSEIPIVRANGSSSVLVNEVRGVDEDLSIETKAVHDFGASASISADFNIAFFFYCSLFIQVCLVWLPMTST